MTCSEYRSPRLGCRACCLVALSACRGDTPPAERELSGAADTKAIDRVAFSTEVVPYARALSPEAELVPLLSVSDRVPRTGRANEEFQLVGKVDGLGADALPNGDTLVLVNHELEAGDLSEPLPGSARQRGAFISELVLDVEGGVVSADRAYDAVYFENTYLGPPADEGNATPALARFCSGSMSYREAGFDRPIYFTGEEVLGPDGFDARGGVGVAVLDRALHVLPKLGRFSRENALAQPSPGESTVLVLPEDSPGSPGNQLYLYVGIKQPAPGASALRANGLDNGSLYVLASAAPDLRDEAAFSAGTLDALWLEIPDAEAMTDAELDTASGELGAFRFTRPEDGAFDPLHPEDFYFVTTGGSGENRLGRLYRARLDPANPTGPTRVEIIANTTEIVAAGGDFALSPDNLALHGSSLLLTEDVTSMSRPKMEELGRNASIWRLDLATRERQRLVELALAGRDGVEVPLGGWESTGVLGVPSLGEDTWLFNVQAHAPTTEPVPNTIEDGQLLLLRRRREP